MGEGGGWGVKGDFDGRSVDREGVSRFREFYSLVFGEEIRGNTWRLYLNRD